MKIMHKPVSWMIGIAFLLSASATNAGDLPDPSLTPGCVNPKITKEILCSPHFHTRDFRGTISKGERKEIYESYGIQQGVPPCPCELDHLIPLSLGGATDPRNLWPQSETTPWSSHLKDQLEQVLPFEVCATKIELLDAQRGIACNWKATFFKRFGLPKGASEIPTSDDTCLSKPVAECDAADTH